VLADKLESLGDSNISDIPFFGGKNLGNVYDASPFFVTIFGFCSDFSK
jgi:hypothetical protein